MDVGEGVVQEEGATVTGVVRDELKRLVNESLRETLQHQWLLHHHLVLHHYTVQVLYHPRRDLKNPPPHKTMYYVLWIMLITNE